MRVLFAENHPGVANDMKVMLESVRMEVCAIDSGRDAVYLAREYPFDVMLVDTALPDAAIHDVVCLLQQCEKDIPVLGLSRDKNNTDPAPVLAAGAKDFLVAPFVRYDVVPRIVAALGPQRPEGAVLTCGPLAVDLFTRMVLCDDVIVPLTTREYGIMEFLMLQKDHVLSRDIIIDELFSDQDAHDTSLISVHICNLRKKLMQATGGRNYIETVYGEGFVLRDYEVPTRFGAMSATPAFGKAITPIDGNHARMLSPTRTGSLPTARPTQRQP